MCTHLWKMIHEKRIHGRTGEKVTRPYRENRGTAVQGKKLARPYREKVDTAVYTRKILTRPCTRCVHFLSSVRLHTHLSTVFSFVYSLLPSSAPLCNSGSSSGRQWAEHAIISELQRNYATPVHKWAKHPTAVGKQGGKLKVLHLFVIANTYYYKNRTAMCVYTPVTRPYMKKGYTTVREKPWHGRTGKNASTAVPEKSWHGRVHKKNADTAVHTLCTLVESVRLHILACTLIRPRTRRVYRIRTAYVPTIQDCLCFSQINTWIWKKQLKTSLTCTIENSYEKTKSYADGNYPGRGNSIGRKRPI